MQQSQQPQQSQDSLRSRVSTRAGLLSRRRYAILAAALAIVTLVSGGLVTQRALENTQADAGTHAPAFTPTAPGAAEQPNTGWSRVWTFPIPAAQRNGANPYLAWSPAQPQTLYLCLYGQPVLSSVKAAPRSPLLFRSSDGGTTWRPLTLPEPAARCAIYPDPELADHIALVDDHNNVFYSADAGNSWRAVLPPPDTTASAPSFEAIVAGRIYMGAYWTSDLHTWTRWYSGATETLPVMAVNPQRPDTLYILQDGCPGAPTTPAGASNGICRSDDGGHSWRFLVSLTHLPGPSPTLCLLPTQPNHLIAWGTNWLQGKETTGPIRSVDGGGGWTTQGLPAESEPLAFSPAAPCSDRASFYGSPLGGLDSLRDDGALYSTVAPGGGGSRPAGIIVYRNGAWQTVAPVPLRANPTSVPPAVVWLPQPDGRYSLLAVSDSALYRFDAEVAG